MWIFLEHQLPITYQFPQQFLENLTGTAYVQLINFQDHIHKSDFHIYHPVTMSNFAQKLAQNQYICVATQNISSLADIISPLLFLKSLRTTAEVELFNFQYPRQKSNFDTNYMKRKSLYLSEKLTRKHNICGHSQNISSHADILVLT